jgi:hypothetical protein
MPPRHTYWTIILEGKPTAFRARTPEELIPTLRQLQGRHPDAVMMWFARGRLWESPAQAQTAFERSRASRQQRDKGWRPGGAHRDPRERFQIPRDEKRRRFAARLRRDDASPTRREGPAPPSDGRKDQRAWHGSRAGRAAPRRGASPKPGGGGRRGGGGGQGR